MREFPLHKLTIRYNATMFTYDLQCGSSPYINWLYGTMVQCLRTIYHAWVPLAWIDYTVQWHNVYVRFTMREFPLHHKLTTVYHAAVPLAWIDNTGAMFTYDLPCGSSPYINWLYGTIPQCLRTIYYAGVPLAWIDYTVQWHNVYVRFIMREFPYIKWLYGTIVQCFLMIFHAGVPLT